MAGRLTLPTPDLEGRGSSLARRVVSLDKELYSPLSLFTQGAVVWDWPMGLALTRVLILIHLSFSGIIFSIF